MAQALKIHAVVSGKTLTLSDLGAFEGKRVQVIVTEEDDQQAVKMVRHDLSSKTRQDNVILAVGVALFVRVQQASQKRRAPEPPRPPLAVGLVH